MKNLYELALHQFKESQREQIAKGLKKYNKPLTPEDLTTDELYHHAMEECVDLSHYLTALREKCVDLETDNVLLKAELAIKTYQLEKALGRVPEAKKPSYLDLDDEN